MKKVVELKNLGKLTNTSQAEVLAENVFEAASLAARLKGLLGESSLAPQTSLWLKPCSSIHTWFMKFNIDVVFVDSDLRVKKVLLGMKPWRMSWPVLGAASTFEFAAGTLNDQKIKLGDKLHVGN